MGGDVKFPIHGFRFECFTLVHLARCDSAIFLCDAADIVRFGFGNSPLTHPLHLAED
jgi:hypothetical protein